MALAAGDKLPSGYVRERVCGRALVAHDGDELVWVGFLDQRCVPIAAPRAAGETVRVWSIEGDGYVAVPDGAKPLTVVATLGAAGYFEVRRLV